MRLLAATFGLVAFSASILYPGSLGTWRWIVALLGAAAAAGLAVITFVAEARLRRRRREFRVTVFDTVAPFVNELNKMAAMTAEGRRKELKGVIAMGLAAASGLPDADRVRATVFQRIVRSGVDVLIPGQSIGQGDAAQSEFRRGTVEGDEVWGAVDQGRARFYPDLGKATPAGWDPGRVRAYRTFAAVPIRTGDNVHGILTLNAPSPGDLTREDVGIMQVIASLLATAFTLGSPPGERRR